MAIGSDIQALRSARSLAAPGHLHGWPRPFFDLRNDNYNPYETTISLSNVANLQVAWSSPADSEVSAPPILVKSVLYVGTRNRLLAINAASGERLWSYFLGEGTVANGVAHWRNLVYVSDVLAHAVYALNDMTGKLIWSLPTQAGTSGPTIIDHTLVFNDFGSVRAVEADTGAPIWTASTGSGSFSFAALSGRTLYAAGQSNGQLYAIDFRSGKVLWSFDSHGGNVPASVALSGDVAYFGTNITSSRGADVDAVDIASHRLLWRSHVMDQVSQTVAVAEGLVYVVSHDGHLYAFDAQTGRHVWSAATGNGFSPTVANGVVYAPSVNGLVYGLDAVTGEQVWSFDPPGGIPHHMIVADGMVYFGTDTNILAMKLPSGPQA